jgi:H(+)-translocating pyrophosphatase
MMKTNVHIKEGAITFLKKEYTYLAIFCAIFAVILVCAVDMPWMPNQAKDQISFPLTTFAFIVGAVTSMACGFIGMKVATDANVKVTLKCGASIHEGFDVAFRGGQVLGFVLVGLALVVLEILILVYKPIVVTEANADHTKEGGERVQKQVCMLFEYISGYGLGGSTVALFGRVGGGIYTKAADVGADLAGKVTHGLEEDSPRNPGTIADNVGDNVGDIAGMGADLFGSLAESTCAALVVSSTCLPMVNTPDAIYFPLIVTSSGILTSFITIWFAKIKMDVDKMLFYQLVVSTVIMTAVVIPCIYILPESMTMEFGGHEYAATNWRLYGCIMMGLWSGMIIGASTEYYTSNKYGPTQALAKSCEFGPAPNIIQGLALGYMSNIIPIICLCATVLVAFEFAAMYGVALAAIGMLGCLPIALTIDGYGPISDNAGGIAEMSNLHENVRERTDELDAAGNTTAAIGKGFAIGSAALVGLALFGAFITRAAETQRLVYPDRNTKVQIDILDPYAFAGLLFGAMLPYWFSALTMGAVGDAAQLMIEEIENQYPHIMNNEPGYPDHAKCIAISTEASLARMIAPGAIVIISPLLIGMVFGYIATAGLLAGIITSGIQIAFSASNTGGAWDNTKKYVEAGKMTRSGSAQDGMLKNFVDGLKEKAATARELSGNPHLTKEESGFDMNPIAENYRIVKKKDPEHAAAVVGDTVGDPLKDTSGPSINILVKLSAITSLVFGTFIAQYGGKLFGK